MAQIMKEVKIGVKCPHCGKAYIQEERLGEIMDSIEVILTEKFPWAELVDVLEAIEDELRGE